MTTQPETCNQFLLYGLPWMLIGIFIGLLTFGIVLVVVARHADRSERWE